MIEIDDAYIIDTYTDTVEKGKLKRGKGSQRQTKTTAMAKSIVLEDLMALLTDNAYTSK